ncbi:hypothetical protein PP175_13745 [Aneurinibacillus sp. Ricciae_BoGa-3]|uniref:type II toxin-antitoxin system death-on-curing family toxin n=1 Tax=Aneurinibacillus sp. Ricciae_BoGa-3 TaxID=3022697 RepID=UPI0023423C0B|nr:Fic family protein [Aneurinibacillus sp. Ricciae_BoGa-3]WCK52512.1 hypothetical protein PP175_13745 [Aneurinibacillus sp. Ricciae_BoGa-3]
MIYITKETAIEINRQMIELYSKGEIVGVKDESLLESAIHRPLQTMFGQSLYKEIFDKATALFESIAKNHVFHS